MNAGGLTRYDAACSAIARAKSVDEASKIRNQAEALRAYAKQAKNRLLEIDCAEIRIRAERRIGQLTADQKQVVGLGKPGPKKIGSDSDPISLKEILGKDHKYLADRGRKLAAVPEKKFERMVGDWRERVSAETERVTTNLLREGEREVKRGARVAPALPEGKFRLLYADPPWRYEHVPETESRAIENVYPTMALDEICALPVPAADDAVLFLWATSPKLAEAIRVLEAWGFTYRTCAVWDKGVIGMGYYFRQQHELLLVAARGSLPVPEPSARVSSVIHAPRGAHSEKPSLVLDLLESMYPTFTERDRLELFNRMSRPGWTQWGNEAAAS